MEKFAAKLRERWQKFDALQKRLVTAAILGPALLIAIYIGGPLFTLLMIVTAIIGYREWQRLVQTKIQKNVEYTAYATLAMGVLLAALTTLKMAIVFLFMGSAVVAVIAHFYVDQGDRRAPPWLAFGVLYLGVPLACIQWLQPEWPTIMTLFAAVWATDSGAYFAGRKIGGPKLAPKISPNKTWSGLVGGAVAAFFLTGFLALVFDFEKPWAYFIYGAVLAAVSQGGDLFESFMKRRAEVKDSGTIIPGHGGLLDRIDGVLTAAPVFLLMILLLS